MTKFAIPCARQSAIPPGCQLRITNYQLRMDGCWGGVPLSVRRHSRHPPSFPPRCRHSRHPRRHSRPHRHSRESGNPHPGLSIRRRPPGFWIPACAGMTVGAKGGLFGVGRLTGAKQWGGLSFPPRDGLRIPFSGLVPGCALRPGSARRLPGGGRRGCTSADRPGRARRRCRNTSAATPATPGRPPRRRWAGCPATPPASSAPPCR